MSFYLGIDIGTSSIKVILLDADRISTRLSQNL